MFTLQNRLAFTLVELLTVMAIIGILASILIGVGGAVRQQQAESRAKGDLQAIALGMEAFKSTYRDYPWFQYDESAPETLFEVLAGLQRLEVSNGQVSLRAIQNSQNAKPVSDLGSLLIENEVIVDPWGNAYQYYYRPAGSGSQYREAQYPSGWPFKRTSFVLLSAGPDGEIENTGSTSHQTGELPSNAEDYFAADTVNSDNIVYSYEF